METIDKKYYKISEVADLLGIPASTLRFWEKHFTIIKPRRNEHGTRFYTPADIESIRMIYYLVKDKGFKLEAAQDEIKRNRDGVSRQHRAIERLTAVKHELENLLAALSRRPD